MSIRLIHLVTWRYRDGSASGVASAHKTAAAATRMVEILEQHGDGMKQFVIEAVIYDEE